LRWGVVGVAGLYAAARFIILAVSTVVTCRTLTFPILRVVRESTLVAALSLAMALAVYSARIGLVHGGVAAGVRLPELVAVGAVVYVALIAWRTPDLLVEIRSLVRSR